MDFDTVFVLLILAIVGLLVLMFWLNNSAKRRELIEVSLTSDEAARIISSAFSSITWSDVAGPGEINRELKSLRGTGPTLSIDIDETPSGSTQVEVWMSHWTTKNGSILGSNHVIVKKRKIIRSLAQTQIVEASA